MFRMLMLVASLALTSAQGMGDVDTAMAGWEQLAKEPEKMAEVMASFRDPEVVAKAQEMINDPVYMAAANKKMAQLTAKAQGMGLLDQQGMPVPGAADAASAAVGGANLAQMMAGGAAARAGAGAGGASASDYAAAGARDY